MPLETVSILDGNTFVVSDRRGDLEATPTDNHGLFLNDTRFLSRWVLTINGMRPAVLSIDEQAYSQVQFFLALDHRHRLRRLAPVGGPPARQVGERLPRGDRHLEPRQGADRPGGEARGRPPTSPTCSRSRTSSQKKGELYRNVDDGSARPRLPARHLPARDASSRRRAGARSREDGLRVPRPPAPRSGRGRPTLGRRARCGHAALAAPAKRRRQAATDRDVDDLGGGARPGLVSTLGAAAAHLPAQPGRSRGAALPHAASRRARCRPRACPGSWRCSVATA